MERWALSGRAGGVERGEEWRGGRSAEWEEEEEEEEEREVQGGAFVRRGVCMRLGLCSPPPAHSPCGRSLNAVFPSSSFSFGCHAPSSLYFVVHCVDSYRKA